MAFFGTTIQEMASNKMSQPYYRFDGSNDTIAMTLTDGIGKGGDGTINMWYYGQDHAGIIFALHGASDTYRYFNFHPYSGENRIGVVDDVGSWQYSVIAENLIDKWSMITMAVNKATTGGTYTIYLNGVAKFTDIAFTGNYPTEPTRLVLGDYISGNYPSKFSTSNVSLYNFALSTAEVEELYSGTSVPFKYKGANQTNAMTNANAASPDNESNATGQWISRNGATVTSDATTWSGSSGSYSIKVVTTGGNTGVWGNQTGYYTYSALPNNTLTIGKKYRLTYTVKTTAGTGTAECYSKDGGTAHDVTAFSTSGDGITTVTKDFIAEGTSLYWGIIGGLSSTFYFDNWRVNPIGAVAEYDGSGMTGTTWYDKSGNGLNGTITGAGLENRLSSLDVLGYGDTVISNTSIGGGDPSFILTSTAVNRSGFLHFKDQGNQAGYIKYTHNGDSMNFHTANSGAPTLALIGDNATFVGTILSKDITINDATAALRMESTTGANVVNLDMVNGGDTLRMGMENSGGGGMLIGGAAYAGVVTTIGGHPLQFGTNETKRLTIDAGTGNATFTGQITANGALQKFGTGAGTNQILTGSKTGVGDGWTDIIYANHTHMLEVKVWATNGSNRNRFSIFHVMTSYGSTTTTEVKTHGYGPTAPTIDNIELQYNNSGYKIQVRITYSSSSTSTVYWVANGMAEGNMYNM